MTTESTQEINWTAVCNAADVSVGEIGTAKHPNGLALAVYNVDGEFYVTADSCTHGKASFYEEGELDGHIVECAWHNGTFDVRTGEALTMPCKVALRSFAAKVEEGVVYINPKPTKLKKTEAQVLTIQE